MCHIFVIKGRKTDQLRLLSFIFGSYFLFYQIIESQ